MTIRKKLFNAMEYVCRISFWLFFVCLGWGLIDWLIHTVEIPIYTRLAIGSAFIFILSMIFMWVLDEEFP